MTDEVTPDLPINREMKDWIGGNFQWLIEKFGADTLRELSSKN